MGAGNNIHYYSELLGKAKGLERKMGLGIGRW